MKHLAITTTLLMTLSGILPVSAYSGIADVNGWSTDQLQEAGITIKPWANDEGRDIPAMRWVEISYDWKKMGEHRHVEMTLYSGTEGLKAASLCRAEHRKGQTDPMKLLFAVPKENIANCYLWILFLEEDKEIKQPQVLGLGDGPQGFSLDAWRMIQLAGGVPEEKPDPKDAQSQQAFERLAPMLAKIPAESAPAVFEGLPHPFNQPALLAAEADIELPAEALSALLNLPWLVKYYHGANPILLHPRFVPKGASIKVGQTPVIIDGREQEPAKPIGRLEIKAVEEVQLVRGYAVSFRYPAEGVFGVVLLVPGSGGWRAITVEGGEQ